MDLEPLQPPLAVQSVALLLVQVNVLLAPALMEVGEAASVTWGCGGGFTVTVTESVAEPPLPVQVSA